MTPRYTRGVYLEVVSQMLTMKSYESRLRTDQNNDCRKVVAVIARRLTECNLQYTAGNMFYIGLRHSTNRLGAQHSFAHNTHNHSLQATLPSKPEIDNCILDPEEDWHKSYIWMDAPPGANKGNHSLDLILS